MKLLFVLLLFILPLSCNNMDNEVKGKWEDELNAQMPFLGHRNWIAITDMAYPCQSGAGILTLYADEPYDVVLEKVKKAIDNAPHVFAHVYNDKELSYLHEEDVPGVTALREKMREICGEELVSVRHEDIISKLDSASKLFKVIIIKTPLTMAYTSTFFELDCNYWNSELQSKLDAEIGADK